MERPSGYDQLQRLNLIPASWPRPRLGDESATFGQSPTSEKGTGV